MRPRAFAPLLVLAITSLAACGSSDDGSSDGSDRADKSAKAILQETATALSKVKSYHLDGTATDKQDGRVALAGDVAGDGRLSLKLSIKDKTATIRVVKGTTYIRANRAFWEAQGAGGGSKVVSLLADKWVASPGGSTEFLRGLLPKDIGYCLQKDAGSLGKTATKTVAGVRMVVIANKGDKPGTAPGQLYVPAEGAALPARIVQTGPQKPGGTPDPRCDSDDEDSSTTASDFRIGNYDQPVDITAPKGALSLKDLEKAAGTSGDEQTS